MQLLKNYRFWLWRRQLVQLLVALGWAFPDAWDYAGRMRTYFNEGYAPDEAVLEDRHHWDTQDER